VPQIEVTEAQKSLLYYCSWYPSERRLLLPPEDISTANWAESHRYVQKSTKPGPWRNINNPPLVGIMNAADKRGLFRRMRTEVIEKGVQTGVTDAVHNILFKWLDGSTDYHLLVMESERKVRGVFKQRVIGGIVSSNRLAPQMSDNPDDTTNYSITMRTGAVLNAAWSGSQATVASAPCPLVVIDEVDKFETRLNIEEAKDRTTTYKKGLTILLSTPGLEAGPIHTEMEACDAIFDYQVVCPDCAHHQPMRFDNFWWPEKGETKKPGEWKRLANRIEREKLARYACGGCGSLWDDYARDRAVLAGLDFYFHGWKMREDVDGPVSAGFHFPSWISPFKSLSEVIGRWLRAQEPGHADKLRAWHNNEAAEPFVAQRSAQTENAILALCDDRPRGLVPKDISVLICLIDTQQKGFYYEVRAFGWGPSLPSWQVREGYVESFKGLEDVLYNSEYADIDGQKHVIQAAFMDSGGGTGTVPNHSRTAEVYGFCRSNPIVRPLKGRQRMTTPVSHSRIDYFPNSKKPIPGGLNLYHVNVTYFKDQLAAKLEIHPDDPGAWRLHAECSTEYARQMTAEFRNERGLWECVAGRPNHYWDIGVYGLAGADILQVKFWKQPGDGSPPKGRRLASKGIEL